MTGSENFNQSIIAPCPHREFCGGCLYNGENYAAGENYDAGRNYAAVLAEKEKGVLALENINCSAYQGMVGADENHRFSYRNKMEYTFGDLVKGGELQLGMHKKGNFMSVITVDSCQLVPQDFNKILRYTLDFCLAQGYVHYNKKSHEGLLRNLIVRRGVRTGELLVDIVTASGDFDEAGWKDGLLALKLDDNIVGIMRTINDGLADMVKCDEQRILFGRDYYMEEICGLKFKVNVFSFFQTNVEAVERLYIDAVNLLSDVSGKTVYDLFCGTGTISQIVARTAQRVVGVEIVEDSVEAARENVKLNGIDNCEFICGDVFRVLSEATSVRPDVIIVDPPRMGLQTKTVNKIASYGVPEILYVSCNPKTLNADLADFAPMGYAPTYIKCYDNFCWTKHVECVTLMTRK